MEKRILVAMAVVMAFSLPFLVLGCGGGAEEEEVVDSGFVPVVVDDEQDATQDPAASMADPSAAVEPDLTPDSETPTEDAMDAGLEATADAVVEDAAAAGGALTAEGLIGTKWNAGGMTFTFEKDGVLKVNDSLPGTWSIDGTTLTVGAMGQDYAATIDGDKIVYDGTPLERAQ
jgi:hypothetical protein